jgi:hypothetical protein
VVIILSFVSLELKIESNGQLEVKLNSTALKLSLQCIIDLDINFRTIECAVTGVEFPRFAKLIKSISQGALCLVPQFIVSKLISWSGRQVKLKIEAKHSVYIVQEIKAAEHFVHDMFGAAENMGIILLESTDSGKTRECSCQFVSVKNTEIGKPYW